MQSKKMENWNELLLVAASSLLTFVVSNGKEIKNIVFDWFKNASSSVKKMDEVYNIIWSANVNCDKISRVAVLRAGNGGSKPTLGKVMKATMLYNSYDSPARNRRLDYQGIPLDRDYIEMLSDVIDGGVAKVIVSEERDSLLNNLYLSEGIKYSEVYHLRSTNKYIYYVSFSTILKSEFFENAETKNQINIALGKLKNIFENNRID